MSGGVCAVMLVKDESDIIETTIRHLLWHVDEVIVADNMSTDGTYDILHERSYFVLDTAFCYREVGSFYSGQPTGVGNPGGRLERNRSAEAEALAERLNREHEEWLAAE